MVYLRKSCLIFRLSSYQFWQVHHFQLSVLYLHLLLYWKIRVSLRFMVKSQTSDKRMAYEYMRVTYEYIRVTYGWHTSTYEWHLGDIRVHTSDIRMTYEYIRVTCRLLRLIPERERSISPVSLHGQLPEYQSQVFALST